MRSVRKFINVTLGFLLPLATAHAAEVALIIDDMGNSTRDAAAFSLPRQVAFSILPLQSLSTPYAQRAAAQEREVLLHMPMQSLHDRALGPGGLTADMHPRHIVKTLEQAFASVPHAIGMNNHMGSHLTQLTLPMRTTMDYLHDNALFFVDSRTTRFSKAQDIALKHGVMNTRRNVFLDHLAEPKHIDRQFRRLLNLSRKYGQAVGIAHPYPETLAYLEQALPTLAEANIQLVALSEIIQTQELARLSEQPLAP